MTIPHLHDLPGTIALVPVHGAVLMPRAQLPIPLTEHEYFTLATTALREHPYLGVVQPIVDTNGDDDVSLYKAGCLGKIVDINEADDAKIILTLGGICRFDIGDEIQTEHMFRTAHVSYQRYEHDLVEQADVALDRPRLINALRGYFKHFDVRPDWKEIDLVSNDHLITTLTMICPLDAREKQAVLEAPSLKEQSQMLTKLIEFNVAEMNQNTLTSARMH
jgi:Lon protease-like protein